MSGEQSNSDRPDLQSGAAIAENTGEKDQETKNLQTGCYDVREINCDIANLENHELGRKHQKNLVKQKNPEGNDMAPTETHPMSEEPSSSSSPNPQTGSGDDATITDDTGEKGRQEKKNPQTGWNGEPSSSSSPILQAGAGTVATIADNTSKQDRQEKKNPQTGWSGEPNSSSSPNLQAGVGTVATIAENTGDQQETKNRQIGLSGEPSSSSSPNPLAGAATVANIAENTDKKDLQETKNPQTGWSGEPNSSNSPNPQAGAGTVATFVENKGEKDQHESNDLQTGWFDVCKINCDIKNLLNHKLGKHPKNMVKQKNPEGEVIAPTQSQNMSGEPNNSSILNQQKWKRKHAPGSSTLDYLETKRRRVLGYGIQPGAIRICHICNVICSHEKVFNDHLAGRKHTTKSRVLKVAAAGNVPAEPLVNAATAGDGCIIVEQRQE